MRNFSFLAIASVLFAGAGLAPAAPADIPFESINVDWLKVEGIHQPVSPDQTGVEVTYTVSGKEVSNFVPIEADTFLWKNSEDARGHATGIILRDARFSEGLIRLAADAVPKEAQITKASLRLKVLWVEGKGQAGTVSCFRVLTPWTEDAAWSKPGTDGAVWNGLQSGKDFEAQMFAQVQVPSFAPKAGGQLVLIPGFGEALKNWRDGIWKNEGFLITLNGKAIQISFGSREAVNDAKVLVLGGADKAAITLTPNLPLLARLLLKPDDLLAAQPQLALQMVKTKPPVEATGQINIIAVGDDSAKGEPVASFPLKDIPAQGLSLLPSVADKLRAWLATNDTHSKLLLTIEGGDASVQVAGPGDHVRKPALALKIHSYPPAQLFALPFRPQPNVYTKVVDGHLNYGGKRLRLWGVVGHPDVERIADMGFNAERVWGPSIHVGDGKAYSEESARRGEMMPYTKGDGSELDVADQHFAELKAHGMFVMFGALTNTIPYEPLYQDGSFISGGDDWTQWKEAMQLKGIGNQSYQYIFVDERLQKIRMQFAKNLLTHVNLYTGKAYGEEENIALYEIFNENAFIAKVLSDGLDKWAPYFKAKLQKQWNEWLVKRYTNDEGLAKAWGKLNPGESLASGTVLPAPSFENRTKYPEQRANDFVHFALDLYDGFNQKFRSYCRSLFPAGVGVNVIPFSFDTMYRPNLPWAYGESRGDVFCDGMYYWDGKSSLDKPPSSYLIDSFTPNKMPVVLYETNIGRPNPYRAEYPIKLAAMASFQDWDGIFWHYWSKVDDGQLPYLAATVAPPVVTHYWTAVQHQTDPVMNTSMALAGRIFLGGYLPAAEAPVIIKAGSGALHSFSTFRGISIPQTTFMKGSKINYQPDDKSALTENGQPLSVPVRLEHAVTSGKDVTWDWPNGRLIIDAPNVKAYVGKVDGDFRFSDGVTLGKVSTPWVAFVIESADGKPLTGPDATSRIIMGAVYDAKNTDFSYNYNVVGGPVEQAKAVRNAGHAPLLVDQVDYTVWFPKQLDGTLKSYDFALREVKSEAITKGNSISQTGPTPFLTELTVNSWGETGSLPLALATVINTDNVASTSAVAATGEGGLTAGDMICPIPGLDWNQDYQAAHKFLENSALVFTNLSATDMGASPDKTISVADYQSTAFGNSTMNVGLTFHADAMTGIELTFKDPPPVEELVTKISALAGQPSEKKIDAQYGSTRIVWKGHGKSPELALIESQGIMKLLYQRPSE